MKKNAIALHLADAIDIRAFKKAQLHKLLFNDSDELFYEVGKQQYIYIFRYGIAAFYNLDETQIVRFKTIIAQFSKNKTSANKELSDTIEISVGHNVFNTEFNRISIVDETPEKLRLILLNLSQSVALDYYATLSEQILEDTRKHTNFLEAKGRLDIQGKTLKKYIGKVLNIKNKISENLYIFDSPDITWEDEELNKLNNSVKKVFDLKERYQIINQQLAIIRDNLDLFKDIMFHKESSKLEWIIIILIVIEVIDLFILKFST